MTRRDVLDLLFGAGAVAPGLGTGADRVAARPGPPLDPALREVLDLVETGAGDGRRGRRRRRGRGRARRRWRSPGSSCSATSRRCRSAASSAAPACARGPRRPNNLRVDGSGRGSAPASAIAGSDSGGGAGIQADLKAFARCGVHGTTAITALTAQNTVGVEMVAAVAPEMIVAQIEAVAADIGVDAVKVGMLADEPTIDAVVDGLELVGEAPVVVDPVMVAESGATLLDPSAKAALIERVLPRAHGGDPEPARGAGALRAGGAGDAGRARRGAARARPGGRGRHRRPRRRRRRRARRRAPAALRIEGPRYPDGAAHGSGCTHSSALAAFLARGEELADAARWAREIASEAVGHGLRELGRRPRARSTCFGPSAARHNRGR